MTNGVQSMPCVGDLPEGFQEISREEYHRRLAAREAEIAAQVRSYAEQARAELAPLRDKILAADVLNAEEAQQLFG